MTEPTDELPETDPRAGTFAATGTPWDWMAAHGLRETDQVHCNICWWSGSSFDGFPHSESLTCPACGAISRDRFLFFSLTSSRPRARYRVLETSPRLGMDYRRAMSGWFDYRASDWDQQAHRADVRLDLQDLDLPSESLDLVLTPHVLEHVSSTDSALSEIHRVLVPGGVVLLQVPVPHGWTHHPLTPEFHADHTAVVWRFGLDLTDRLREQGFRTELLCTWGFFRQVQAGALHWPDPTPRDLDVPMLLRRSRTRDLVPIAGDDITARLGFHPGYMFLTWRGTKPVS